MCQTLNRLPTLKKRMLLCFVCIAIMCSERTMGITSIQHHDKPEEMTGKSAVVNSTEEQGERQKRLLPYMTFYLEQDFNHPHSQQGSAAFATTGALKQPTVLQHYHTKFAELTNGISYHQSDNNNKPKVTPFLDSNALPGPFIPMRVQVAPVNEVAPNYSTIYDKLSQLKLQQQYYNRPSAAHYAPANVPRIQQQQQQQQLSPAAYIPIRNDETAIYPTSHKDVGGGGDEGHGFAVIDNNEQTYNEAVKHPAIHLHAQPPPPPLLLPPTAIRGHLIPIAGGEVKKHLLKPIILVPQKGAANVRPHVAKPIFIIQRKPPPSGAELPINVQIVDDDYASVKLQKYQPQTHEERAKFQYNLPQPIPPPPNYQHQHQRPSQGYYARNEPQKKQKYHSIIELQYPDEHEKPIFPKYVTLPPSPTTTVVPLIDSEPIYHEGTNSLSLILKKLQDTNALPRTLTADNIDNSIRTLVKILSSLKKQPKFQKPILAEEDTDYVSHNEVPAVPGTVTQIFPENTPEGGTPGTPGVDYPALSSIPQTTFNCKTQRYKGFFGDPDTSCQVWHYCDLNGGQASFLCPNGTIFSQVALTCDWWYNVKCSNTAQQYVLNERLYKYILPLSPKFPEDYSGPLVDRYLALKFQEMEEKMKKERKPNKENENGTPEEMENEAPLTTTTNPREEIDSATDSNQSRGIISAPIIVPDDSNETSATASDT